MGAGVVLRRAGRNDGVFQPRCGRVFPGGVFTQPVKAELQYVHWVGEGVGRKP